ncbi:hypothetical protein HUU05_10350 [candidate division KSB1 bacterium]|nr:hypothetical protein [candidate division KSB1 bacterium]
MPANNPNSPTDKALDRFEEFLKREIADPSLAEQIPSGAHLFHGSYNDAALTRANLKLSSKILLGMALGFVEEAPLLMIYEYLPGRQKIIDLSSEKQKHKVRSLFETFEEQSHRDITLNLDTLQAA